MKKQPLGHYRPRFTNQHACRVCGAIFAASRHDARYCSPRCRQFISRAMRRATDK